MLYVNKITQDASQIMVLTGITGIQITVTLRYMPRIQQWIMGVDDGTTFIQGISVVNGLNILRQWKNVISYGIQCTTNTGVDPYLVTDFANQVANLYLLDADDVAAIESAWFT